MRMLCVILISCGLLLTACKSKPPIPEPPKPIVGTLSWTPGNCHDNFIVYQEHEGIWQYLGETTALRYRFQLQPKEVKELTVAGVCYDGAEEGEWISMESVIAKR